MKKVPKPREIKAYLDEYIIGQDEAKRHLAVSVYNHYKRLQQPVDENGVEIEKSNIIMVGSTGTGKTLLARTIAKLLDVPFTIVDATVFTEAGYVGYNSVQNVRKIDKEDLMQYVLPQDLKSFGLIPEIIGRLPVLTYLKPLDRDALRRILMEPKNSIVKQYVKLFEMDGITLTFDDAALDYIVDKAVEYKLGARGLRSIVESVMMDAMFEIPSKRTKKFEVTLEYAKQQLDKSHLHHIEQQ